ncbi:MAG: phytanoyl-CoA dioxygenase family protein [Acidiferrobacterales bacterium]|nr:phytanoyl-CoA dioxygenase family protein [Acidiferrobacterales bacterium]
MRFGNSNQVLEPNQIDFFHQHGYVMLENAIPTRYLGQLNHDLDEWVRQSADYVGAYGEQLDGRPRFSLELEHSREKPALRRVASPVELSNCYLEFMRDNPGLDAVAQLIGPNVKFNNSKINLKHPGSKTAVKFHQDFSFEPHTNDSLVAVLYFLNEVTPENGPLQVVPGSHKGNLYDLWQDGVFTGAVNDEIEEKAAAESIPCTGAAASACLMHTRLLHGSAPNLSSAPRNLCILTYTAEDAYPLQPNHIPSRYEGELVRGRRTNQVRCSDYDMVLPAHPTGASFFEQQAEMT